MKAHYIPTESEISSILQQKARQSISRKFSIGLAIISFAEIDNIFHKFGSQTHFCIMDTIHQILIRLVGETNVIQFLQEGKFYCIIQDTNPENLKEMLNTISTILVEGKYHSEEEVPVNIELTPVIGYALFPPADSIENLIVRADLANKTALVNLDLVPIRYNSSMDYTELEKVIHWLQEHPKNLSLRLFFQLFLVIGISWLVPIILYFWFDSIWFDITHLVYLILVISMLITSSLIWIEGMMAFKQNDPPEINDTDYPTASAIIVAYLPNEAETIIETLEAYFQIDYPNTLQIILAYNTPKDLPIEKKLKTLARKHSNLLLLRVDESHSKAQNVNSALSTISGEFVGIFDADHHPRPDSFRRAWRWLSDGYDIVQGHCLVRNGHSTWLSKLVAVEFEAIYAVSHPGRSKLYQFAIFGGSNGYWRTELINKTRMHGFMLTEDIDASIRVVKNGFKIKSDPLLISTELAPITIHSLWNQRLRWAQGWNQVSKIHFGNAIIEKNLSIRQRIGIFWLLGWREFYPWISIQMYPLIIYWAIKYHGVNQLDWLIPIFILTTIFTFSIGPAQVWFSYKLSDHTIKTHRKWFWNYLVFSSLVYSEFKNWIGRIAQVKELMGEKQWNITPRELIPPTR